jgi:hypothetical protein
MKHLKKNTLSKTSSPNVIRVSIIFSLISAILLSNLAMAQLTRPTIVSSGILSSGRIGMAWLHTEGKFVVDSAGNNIVLRGANFMGYEFGERNRHTEEDYIKIASWGFNVVRLPIAWHYVEPQPGIYNFSYLKEYVDRDIEWARKHGIYIILDMHQWYWSPHFTLLSGERGKGMPSWLVSAYPDSSDGETQAVTDFWLGKGPNGTASDETNPSMQTRFIDMWKKVASIYAYESSIAAFDIFNEPYRGNLSREEQAECLYAFYQKLIPEIRKVDMKHIIVYEHTASITSKQAELLNYSNVMFSFHYGRLKENYDGNRTRLESLFLEYFDRIANWNIPIYVGEFNTHIDWPNASQWVHDMVDVLNKYGLSWTWWSYYRSDYYAAALCYYNGTERIELTQHLKIQ